MLIDKHAKTLMPVLIKSGLEPDMQMDVIKFADRMIKDMRAGWKRDGAQVGNLDKSYDWNKLIN